MSPTSYQTAPPRGEGIQDSEPRRSSHLGIWARSFSLCAVRVVRGVEHGRILRLVRAQPSMLRGAVAVLFAAAPLVAGCSTGAQTTSANVAHIRALHDFTGHDFTGHGCRLGNDIRIHHALRHRVGTAPVSACDLDLDGEPSARPGHRRSGGTVRVSARSRVRHGSSLLGRRQPVAAQLPRRHVGKHPRSP